LSYFVRNESAVDSLEGIAKWRLLEEAIHRNVRETEQALEWLVRQGYLKESPQPHAGRLYSFNTAKRVEAQSLLDGEQRQWPPVNHSSTEGEAK
jgi:hypothetical protein